MKSPATTWVGGAALVAAACVTVSGQAGEIDQDLGAALGAARPGDSVSALLYLFDKTDIDGLEAEFDARRSRLAERHEAVVRALQATAARSQQPVLDAVEALRATGAVTGASSYWIDNIVHVVGTPDAIRQLAARPDVDRAFLDYPIELIRPVRQGAVDGGGADAPEPGVVAVRAPEVWALGIDGTGVLVANIDTGVDGTHPALASRWRGNDPEYAGHPEWAFHDPTDYSTQDTFDTGSHGTHTMGSVCGGAPGDEVGVAPGAQWIASAAIDVPGEGIPGTVVNAIAAFQWIVDPDGNPSTSTDVPAVVSNSWGLTTGHGYSPCDETFWVFMDGAEAAGVVVIFSAGNEGSSGLRRPGDRASTEYNAFAVAAVQSTAPYSVASFSSRGPTNCTPDGSPAIKPDIAAPGVNVRSSIPGGGYTQYDGTSMASPHINGVVALMRQANPDLPVDQVKQAIYDTAVDLGTPGEDNSYGYGLVDAYEAVQVALSLATVQFEYPDGQPEFVHPMGGTTLRIDIVGQSAIADPATGLLHYSSDGVVYDSVSIAHLGGDAYEATFPPVPCGSTVNYYFSIDTTDGETVYNPFIAPEITYSALGYAGIQTVMEDDFETDMGWTIESVDVLEGEWERGVPAGGDVVPGDRYEPPTDADGSGQCYVTLNAPGDSDLDGGPTYLTSPRFDASSVQDPWVEYDRWLGSSNGDPDDPLTVEVSNDDGASWVVVEQASATETWEHAMFVVADYIEPTNLMRVRFTAIDNPSNSILEAGVDGFMLRSYTCGGGIEGDVDGDGDVDVEDLLAVLSNWGPCSGCPADLDGDGQVGVSDLLTVLANWS